VNDYESTYDANIYLASDRENARWQLHIQEGELSLEEQKGWATNLHRQFLSFSRSDDCTLSTALELSQSHKSIKVCVYMYEFKQGHPC
jgi:hypothetical protein